MAKPIKPVSLLSPDTTRHKSSNSSKPAEVGLSSPAKAVPLSTGASSPGAKHRILSWSLAVLLLALLLTPKPELIVYQQLNIQAKSVYWPGFFGMGAGLTDSQMLVFFDNERREMRLCYAGEPAVQCSKYQIIYRGGLLDVGRYLLDLH